MDIIGHAGSNLNVKCSNCGNERDFSMGELMFYLCNCREYGHESIISFNNQNYWSKVIK